MKAWTPPPEYEYDVLTELAAQICSYPVALISLMDEHRQWFKSNYGVSNMTECPPEISVCSTTVCANELRRQLISRETMLAEVNDARASAEQAHARSEAILNSVFPTTVANELYETGKVEPRFFDLATVMFADFKDSTLLTEGMEPVRLIEHLNSNFAIIDEIGDANRVLTLRTVGDGSLCVAGIPETNRTHPVDMCLMALQLQHSIGKKNQQRELMRLKPWQIRLGINTGSVVAGVVGTRRYTYDVWGSAVNLAARLEQTCEPGGISISPSTLHYVESLFETEPQDSVEVKNMGCVDVHSLIRIKPEYSIDQDGCIPNDIFWQTAEIGSSLG